MRTFILAYGDKPRGQVGHSYGGFGLVDVLTAGTASAKQINADVAVGNLKLVLFVRFRENDDRRGGSMYPPLRFSLGNALNAMSARLESQKTVRALSDDGENDFLIAVEARLISVHKRNLPAFRLAIARIHSEKIACEKRRFLAACSRADFEDRVAAFKRIGLKKSRQKALLDLRKGFFKRRDLGFGLFFEIGIRKEFLVALYVAENLVVRRVRAF